MSQTRPTLLEKVLLAATEKAVLYSGGISKWQSSTSGLKKEVLDNSVDQTLDLSSNPRLCQYGLTVTVDNVSLVGP